MPCARRYEHSQLRARGLLAQLSMTDGVINEYSTCPEAASAASAAESGAAFKSERWIWLAQQRAQPHTERPARALMLALRREVKACVHCQAAGMYVGKKGPRMLEFKNMKCLYFS